MPVRGRPALAAPGAATERILSLRPTRDLADAVAGINWFNALSRADRAHWLYVAGSAVPADAWSAFKRARSSAAEVQS